MDNFLEKSMQKSVSIRVIGKKERNKAKNSGEGVVGLCVLKLVQGYISAGCKKWLDSGYSLIIKEEGGQYIECTCRKKRKVNDVFKNYTLSNCKNKIVINIRKNAKCEMLIKWWNGNAK